MTRQGILRLDTGWRSNPQGRPSVRAHEDEAITLFRFALLTALLGATLLLHAGNTVYEGMVTAVYDGDTLLLRTPAGASLKVRLEGIDAPERGQSYGTLSKQALTRLALNRRARLEVSAQDRYGRLVGRLFVNGLDVNAELIRQGMAWVYRQYTQDETLIRLEQEARTAKRGLWAAARPTPPWRFRENQKPQTQTRIRTVHQCRQANGVLAFQEEPCAQGGKTTPLTVTPPAPRKPAAAADTTSPRARLCARRPTCKALQTCKEARFFLNVCGFRYLDRDGDGIPCKALCKR